MWGDYKGRYYGFIVCTVNIYPIKILDLTYSMLFNLGIDVSHDIYLIES